VGISRRNFQPSQSAVGDFGTKAIILAALVLLTSCTNVSIIGDIESISLKSPVTLELQSEMASTLFPQFKLSEVQRGDQIIVLRDAGPDCSDGDVVAQAIVSEENPDPVLTVDQPGVGESGTHAYRAEITSAEGQTVCTESVAYEWNSPRLSAVGMGFDYGCGITVEGQLKCWGSNSSGQLGIGSASGQPVRSATTVQSSVRFTAVAAGVGHACAIAENTTVYCWGYNAYGQLGDGTQINRTNPTLVTGLSGVAELALGLMHSCARLTGGQVYCWGQGGYIGDGTPTLRVIPTATTGVTTATQIKSRSRHTCALLANQTVRCWGAGFEGQIGDGGGAFRQSPALVTGISNASAISVGADFSCAVLSDGAVRCWGRNTFGTIGNGNNTQQNTPALVSGLSNAVEVEAGDSHTCARLSNGKINCWGLNTSKQLGNGSMVNTTSPVEVAHSVTATELFLTKTGSCALTSEQQLLCWGANQQGEFGSGREGQMSHRPEFISKARQVISLESHYAGGFVLDSLNRLFNWGYLAFERKPFSLTPDFQGFRKISHRFEHGCGILTDGTVRCWGGGSSGQLGDGLSEDSATPVEVVGLTDVSQVATGTTSTCALIQSGEIYCWGFGEFGELGNGEGVSLAAPGDPVTGISNAQSVAVGSAAACALLSEGAVVCWGAGAASGDPGGSPALDPRGISLPLPATAITVGGAHACAILEDRRVFCWGQNLAGELGDGTSGVPSGPVSVIGINDALVVQASSDLHTCAISESRGVVCWGSNEYSVVNYGQTEFVEGSYAVTRPVEVVGVGKATALALGYRISCALLVAGTVQCWGYDGTSKTEVDVQTVIDLE